MRLLVLLVVAVSMVMAGSVTIKTLVFPTATSTSLVEIFPLKPLQLQAFTLLSLYLTGEGFLFALPQLGALETHLCITWESGSVCNFLLPEREEELGQNLQAGSRGPIRREGYPRPGRRQLPGGLMPDLYSGKRVQRGNVFDWETAALKVFGQVAVVT
ncbi:hypothetical protein INR49_005943, partial [Caranx melampygus]